MLSSSPADASRLPPPIPEKTATVVQAARRLSMRVNQSPPSPGAANASAMPPSRLGLTSSINEEGDEGASLDSSDALSPKGGASEATTSTGGAAGSPLRLDNMVETLSQLAANSTLTAPVMLSSRNSFMVDTDTALRESEAAHQRGTLRSIASLQITPRATYAHIAHKAHIRTDLSHYMHCHMCCHTEHIT